MGLGGAAWGRGLDSVILVDPFQVGIFDDSVNHLSSPCASAVSRRRAEWFKLEGDLKDHALPTSCCGLVVPTSSAQGPSPHPWAPPGMGIHTSLGSSATASPPPGKGLPPLSLLASSFRMMRTLTAALATHSPVTATAEKLRIHIRGCTGNR